MQRTIAPLLKTTTIDTEQIEYTYREGGVNVILLRGFMQGRSFVMVSQETIPIGGTNYDALMAPNATGKKAGQFRTDDLWAIVDKLKA